MTAALAITNLSVALGGDRRHRLLRSVNLSVAPGEVHGLVGESGAGKSMIGKTVFGILPGAARVVEGEIRFNGVNLLALGKKELRTLRGREMALIPQDPLTALNPSRRIGPQLTDRLVRILGHTKADATRRARDLLEEVQIRDPDRVMRAYPHELSGGMRQRVLIAEAFVAEPKLIVADEPTTALDVTVQRKILGLIAAMQARHGAALLFVTHDLGVVAKVCQSVSVLFGGHVVEQGRTGEILAAPQTAYTRALLAATPRYDRPDAALTPVAPKITAALTLDNEWADTEYAR
ncbi:ABC transporter ATP-binding protein [Acuticoccus sp. MNP-M23]|uniref:ABC transporter ATP-binding protein n=1 Tax=Acuticoccus sp. MNP-M23 TaxID=3072793 RepID=UPI0028166B13|nr:ABC transporter ATP-binding protein [Acuticoccus sp. MNP-M23]WMS42831.1 ABC transporter ATP-binding protein [Acuticoccus sp. MNP-M23]